MECPEEIEKYFWFLATWINIIHCEYIKFDIYENDVYNILLGLL